MKTLDLDLRDAGLYNAVINGNFDFWQRGTTITRTQAVNITGYLADKAKCGMNGATAKSVTLNRSTQVPSSSMPTQALYSYEIVNNTAVASYVAADYILPYYSIIEGNIFQPLFGKDFTIGLWAYSSISIPLFPISIINGAGTFSYVAHVSLSIGWNYVSTVIPWNSNITALDSNASLTINLGALAGSTFQASALNAWVAGNVPSHSTSTNWASASGVTLRFSQIQMRSGQWSTADMQNSFRTTGVSYTAELALCQRYYERMDNISSQNTSASITIVKTTFQYKAEKRAIPTVTVGQGATESIFTSSATSFQSNAPALSTYSTGLFTADADF